MCVGMGGSARTDRDVRVAQIIKWMIQDRMYSNKPEHNLNFLRAYQPIAQAVIEVLKKD